MDKRYLNMFMIFVLHPVSAKGKKTFRGKSKSKNHPVKKAEVLIILLKVNNMT